MNKKSLIRQIISIANSFAKNLAVYDDFGNISLRNKSSILIKTSGSKLISLKNNNIVELGLNEKIYGLSPMPSTDTPTHQEIYKAFGTINSIVHSHSQYATAWAQAGKPIPCLGTTHADYWNSEIPITRDLTKDEINGEYEKETGKIIIEEIKKLNVDPLDCPGILVANHGPFTWGKTIEEAVKHAELLEYIARLAWMSLSINIDAKHISNVLLNKHFSRKHGPDAYYGQDPD